MQQKAILSRCTHGRRQEKWLGSCNRIKGKTVSPLGRATRDVTRKTRRKGTATEEKETKEENREG